MTDPTKAIKDALEAGPTPGPWEARCRDVSYMGGDWGRVKFLQWEVYGPEEPPGRGAFFQADAQLIAACNPTAISSLLSRLEDAERDARRYRWLRHCNAKDSGPLFTLGTLSGETLDAAIDEAMKEGQG